jgi:hypothetical protein
MLCKWPSGTLSMDVMDYLVASFFEFADYGVAELTTTFGRQTIIYETHC